MRPPSSNSTIRVGHLLRHYCELNPPKPSPNFRIIGDFLSFVFEHGKVTSLQPFPDDAPHLVAGPNPKSNNDFGYGYQWWIFDGEEGEYAALGIYNQMIYINPTRNIVIVKSSANSGYGTTNDETSFREKETLAMLRTIVKTMK